MQRGDLKTLSWAQPTFAANTIVNWGELQAFGRRVLGDPDMIFPEFNRLLAHVRQRGASTKGLDQRVLRNKAMIVAATALGFEHVLKAVQPSMCFIVTYYLAMGHALALACRRRGVLSVELQREGRGSRHEAYRWLAVPDEGYTLLPAVFWSWGEEDADMINGWTRTLSRPWHRAIHGGPPHLASWFEDNNPRTQAYDAKIREIRVSAPAELEILVALQNHDGYVDVWNDLAALIERSPREWRWWLRRHPRTADADRELGRLTAIRRPNVLIEEASAFPLPALLRHMDVLLSVRSGAAVEASAFGVPSIFLSGAARELFPDLVETGKAEIVDDIRDLEARLASTRRATGLRRAQPKLSDVLSGLDAVASEYAALCANPS